MTRRRTLLAAVLLAPLHGCGYPGVAGPGESRAVRANDAAAARFGELEG